MKKKQYDEDVDCGECFYFHKTRRREDEEYEKGYCSQKSAYIEHPEWKDYCNSFLSSEKVNDEYDKQTESVCRAMKKNGVEIELINRYRRKRDAVPRRS